MIRIVSLWAVIVPDVTASTFFDTIRLNAAWDGSRWFAGTASLKWVWVRQSLRRGIARMKLHDHDRIAFTASRAS